MSQESQDQNQNITWLNKKRAVIMLLGNQGDVNSLVSMLEKESDQRILLQIIGTLGSLGRVECIDPLRKFIGSTPDPVLQTAAESSIETITKISSYGLE